jgi:hypothetical protein
MPGLSRFPVQEIKTFRTQDTLQSRVANRMPSASPCFFDNTFYPQGDNYGRRSITMECPPDGSLKSSPQIPEAVFLKKLSELVN